FRHSCCTRVSGKPDQKFWPTLQQPFSACIVEGLREVQIDLGATISRISFSARSCATPQLNFGSRLFVAIAVRVENQACAAASAGASRPLRTAQVRALVVWMLVLGSPWIANRTLAIAPRA